MMRNVWVILGCLTLVTTAQARSDELSTDNKVTATFNKTSHYGNMNGVRIAVPPKYWASVDVQMRINSNRCENSSVSDQLDCPISKITLQLRRSTFDPIYTKSDLVDWGSNHLRPYDQTSLDHRWIGVTYRADLYENAQNNLDALYRSHVTEVSNHLGGLRCDSKYGLDHCSTKKEDGPLVANEFYFDSKTGQTLIECVRLALPYLGCHQYYLVPELKATAETGTSSDLEIAEWASINLATRQIANTLIAK